MDLHRAAVIIFCSTVIVESNSCFAVEVMPERELLLGWPRWIANLKYELPHAGVVFTHAYFTKKWREPGSLSVRLLFRRLKATTKGSTNFRLSSKHGRFKTENVVSNVSPVVNGPLVKDLPNGVVVRCLFVGEWRIFKIDKDRKGNIVPLEPHDSDAVAAYQRVEDKPVTLEKLSNVNNKNLEYKL